MNTKSEYDVIIVGAGAAGLSAALVLSRAMTKVLLLDSGKPRNAPASHMHGFITRDGIPPKEFLAIAREEVVSYGGEFRSAIVNSIERTESGLFSLTFNDNHIEKTQAILIATGLVDELPNIPGLQERWGDRVHHCPYCHGNEVKGKEIVIIGGAHRELSLKQVALLRPYSERIVFVTNGIELTSEEQNRFDLLGIKIIDAGVSELSDATENQTSVALDDGCSIKCDAVFVAPRPQPHDALLRNLECETDSNTGLVIVDAHGKTTVEGVWAAGNVVNPMAQVISAAGAGSSSAISINGWLVQK